MCAKALVAFSLVMMSLPAQALPSQTLAETKAWTAKHAFLSHWLVGNSKLDGFPFERIVFQELPNHWFIDDKITFAPPAKGASLDTAKALFDTLYFVQKQYVGSAKPDGEIHFDPRPWKDITCQNIWTPDNQTAASLLSQIYSPSLAHDFIMAKPAYQGGFYLPSIIGAGELGFLWNPPKAKPEDVKQKGMFRRVTSDVTIYLGEQYAYEVRSNDYPGIQDQPLTQSPGCIGLKINPRAWGVATADTLKYNQDLYTDWQKTKPPKPQPSPSASPKAQ